MLCTSQQLLNLNWIKNCDDSSKIIGYCAVNFNNTEHSFNNPFMNPLRWYIFCRVIDNLGDAGVCLRLARELAGRGQLIELWIDRPGILDWMEPSLHPHIKVFDWPNEGAMTEHTNDDQGGVSTTGYGLNDSIDVIVEAFGCEIPESFKKILSKQAEQGTQKTQWINLEYLSAESYAEQNHGLLSPVLSGPGVGAKKWFFYPGFTERTGGLILEQSVHQKIIQSQPSPPPSLSRRKTRLRVGLFCYAHAPLKSLLDTIKHQDWADNGITLNIPQGEAQRIVNQSIDEFASHDGLSHVDIDVCNFDRLTQNEFDEMLWSNDLNFVRGEDSLVRAIWVGKPWIWQIYKQSDGAHETKLNALLDLLNCPHFVKEIHWSWNQCSGDTFTLASMRDVEKWSQWSAWCLQIRSKLTEQADLVTQLMAFVDEKRQKTVES